MGRASGNEGVLRARETALGEERSSGAEFLRTKAIGRIELVFEGPLLELRVRRNLIVRNTASLELGILRVAKGRLKVTPLELRVMRDKVTLLELGVPKAVEGLGVSRSLEISGTLGGRGGVDRDSTDKGDDGNGKSVHVHDDDGEMREREREM